MKKVFVLLFSLIFVVVLLSSCSKDENTSTAESITTTTGTTVTTSETEIYTTTSETTISETTVATTTTEITITMEPVGDAKDALAKLNGGGLSAGGGNQDISVSTPSADATSTTTASQGGVMEKDTTGEWLSGYVHKPLQCNVLPNQLYWGTTSMDQMNGIAEELDYLFNERNDHAPEDAGSTITIIELYYNRDIVKTPLTDYCCGKNNYQKIPASKFEATEENFKIWCPLGYSLLEYYGVGSSDGGMNDNAYIAYSTYMDSGFRTGANANCDCGGEAEFLRSFYNYLGYETRYVTGRQYGTNHAGLQVRCQDTGKIVTINIDKPNIKNYGPWE